jgi:hypothetical protein
LNKNTRRIRELPKKKTCMLNNNKKWGSFKKRKLQAYKPQELTRKNKRSKRVQAPTPKCKILWWHSNFRFR